MLFDLLIYNTYIYNIQKNCFFFFCPMTLVKRVLNLAQSKLQLLSTLTQLVKLKPVKTSDR